MSLSVKWGRERFSMPFPPPDTKLLAIRSAIAEHTHLPLHSFKLIHAGAVMKDDNAPIAAYSLHPSSVIAVIGSYDSASAPQSTQLKTEQYAISQIQSELAQVRNHLLPSLDTYISETTTGKTSDAQRLHKEHMKLSELLLQSLLRLDAIYAEGEWEIARRERKDAVKEVQNYLDRLDGGPRES